MNQEDARRLEQTALAALRNFDRGKIEMEEALSALCEYQDLHDPGKDRRDQYCDTLSAAAWRECDCEICEAVGIQVVMFRGTERNKRRGFHNLYVFAGRLRRELEKPDQSLLTTA